MRITLPNQVTLGRLVLAIVFFIVLAFFQAEQRTGTRWVLAVSFWLFLAAALADVLDGLLARMMNQVTSFGRVVDPVVDKVMVCGAFVYFSSQHFNAGGRNITDVAPWMVLVILLRELLVSALRAHSESEGRDFGANWAGKLKMLVQSATVCVILGQLAWYEPNLSWLRTGCVWLTVVVTALSTLPYARRAHSFLLSGEALGGPPPAARPDAGVAALLDPSRETAN
ncbi:CDP-diacylglycerol--glycerol-3-phosphate 3-phosphatidyltransferase [Phycisphaerae bacterium RAS1]|nr:CDP-diacylglycerol--glycerol-3-phosphate 3-phosphatidyltransferase [Phycisphaerae bacterium RAS1]